MRSGSVSGDIFDRSMYRNRPGDIVAASWLWLAEQYSYVLLDEWVVMPDHLHGIIVITGSAPPGAGTSRDDVGPYNARITPPGPLVGAFKTISTKQFNLLRRTLAVPLWQRNNYQRIMRDTAALQRVRASIAANPSTRENVKAFRRPPGRTAAVARGGAPSLAGTPLRPPGSSLRHRGAR